MFLHIFGLLSVSILLLVGYFLSGVSISASATIYTLIIFLLPTTMMVGFGMIFGGLTIWLKNIGETVPLLQSVFMFFCGVCFPIAILPTFLQPIAKYLPFYYPHRGFKKIFDSFYARVRDVILCWRVADFLDIICSIRCYRLAHMFNQGQKRG